MPPPQPSGSAGRFAEIGVLAINTDNVSREPDLQKSEKFVADFPVAGLELFNVLVEFRQKPVVDHLVSRLRRIIEHFHIGLFISEMLSRNTDEIPERS